MAIFNLLSYKLPSDYNKSIIIDTNIWLLLYSELHEVKEREIAAYSNFLDEIIEKDIKIIITSSIISEITNVLLRADFNSLASSKGWKNFKRDYVGSESFSLKVSEINSIINSIFQIDVLNKIDDNFSNITISKIQENFNIVDWNDAYLYDLSLKFNFDILSHDRDFRKFSYEKINLIQLKQ